MSGRGKKQNPVRGKNKDLKAALDEVEDRFGPACFGKARLARQSLNHPHRDLRQRIRLMNMGGTPSNFGSPYYMRLRVRQSAFSRKRSPSDPLNTTIFCLSQQSEGAGAPGSSAAEANQTGGGSTGREVDQLFEMFKDAGFNRDVVEDVYASSAYDLDQAVGSLLAMQADHEAAGVQPEPAEEAENLWDLLSTDVQGKVVALLTNRELARVATVSRTFAALVRAKRQKVPVLNIPPGLARKPHLLVDVLRAHPAARAVALQSGTGADLRGADEFGALFEALALADIMRASLQQQQGLSPVVRLEAVDLRGCAGLTDHDVGALAEALPALRELRLAGCEQ